MKIKLQRFTLLIIPTKTSTRENGRIHIADYSDKKTDQILSTNGDRRVRDRMVVGFTTAYAISAYHR